MHNPRQGPESGLLNTKPQRGDRRKPATRERHPLQSQPLTTGLPFSRKPPGRERACLDVPVRRACTAMGRRSARILGPFAVQNLRVMKRAPVIGPAGAVSCRIRIRRGRWRVHYKLAPEGSYLNVKISQLCRCSLCSLIEPWPAPLIGPPDFHRA